MACGERRERAAASRDGDIDMSTDLFTAIVNSSQQETAPFTAAQSESYAKGVNVDGVRHALAL